MRYSETKNGKTFQIAFRCNNFPDDYLLDPQVLQSTLITFITGYDSIKDFFLKTGL